MGRKFDQIIIDSKVVSILEACGNLKFSLFAVLTMAINLTLYENEKQTVFYEREDSKIEFFEENRFL